MKLSEMDRRVRKSSRAAAAGDLEGLGMAMRDLARSRGSQTWTEPGLDKQVNKLKSYGKSWRLATYPFTVSFNSNDLTDQQAITLATNLLNRNHIETGSTDVYDDEEEEEMAGGHTRWLGVDIEVSTGFIERLAQTGGDIGFETEGGSVYIDAQWYD